MQRFFKTDKGDYAQNDVFIGVMVPEVRKIAAKYAKEVDFEEIRELLNSKIHEERQCALLILVCMFEKAASEEQKQKILEFYIDPSNLRNINKWDLVDLSCYKILGEYLLKKPEKIAILYDFAGSDNIWIRRIAMVSTLTLIRNNHFLPAVKIAEILLTDKHPLIHKATGWMMRELGKRDREILLKFLEKNHQKMARISLSYAIERLSNSEKAKYRKASARIGN